MDETKLECPYKGDCCDVGSERCKVCLNNKKRSYFRPINETEPVYVPYPYDPNRIIYYYPYTTTTYYCTGNDPSDLTVSKLNM